MLAPLGSHLPWLNGARITLPRHDRTVSQIVGLERRVTRAGKDSIDHAPHGHDDLANAVAGVVNSLCVGGDSWLERWGPALYGRDEWEKLRNDAQARSKAEQQAWESQQLWKHIRENS